MPLTALKMAMWTIARARVARGGLLLVARMVSSVTLFQSVTTSAATARNGITAAQTRISIALPGRLMPASPVARRATAGWHARPGRQRRAVVSLVLRGTFTQAPYHGLSRAEPIRGALPRLSRGREGNRDESERRGIFRGRERGGGPEIRPMRCPENAAGSRGI